MNLRRRWYVGGAAVLATLLCGTARAQDKEQAELAKALKGVTVSLEQGLTAAATGGTPISGKFEVEDGKLQLSVYTMKGKQFSEVIVDHKTGKLAKTEAISGGEDLAAAREQSAALAKTKQSLQTVVQRVLKANPGSRAVTVTPGLEGGVPTAKVTLLQGTKLKTVAEKLD